MNILIFTFSPYHDVYEHSSVAGYIMEIQIAAYYLANAYNMLFYISYYVLCSWKQFSFNVPLVTGIQS